jgi:hypothetical protein
MSETIDVRCEAIRGGAWACAVTVDDDRGDPTHHDVMVTTSDLEMLAPGATDPVDLVRRSFDFLLVRERKESILARFDLPQIGRYFPEYESSIRGYDPGDV